METEAIGDAAMRQQTAMRLLHLALHGIDPVSLFKFSQSFLSLYHQFICGNVQTSAPKSPLSSLLFLSG